MNNIGTAEESAMRIAKFAITSALIACLAVPVTAATRVDSRKPTYEGCQALAMNRGVSKSERSSSEQGPSAYEQFMAACLAGKVDGTREQVSERWTNCVRRRVGNAAEYRSSDAWLQIMVGCVAAGAR